MEKTKVTGNCRTKTQNSKMTLLGAIESVVEGAKDSQLCDQFFIKCKAELKFLADSYGITPRQAALFCACMERGPRRIDFDDLASFLDLNTIRILSYGSDIDALVHRRLLRYRDASDEDSFDVPAIVVKSLKHNEVYQLPKRTGLDAGSMLEYMNMWFEDLNDDAVSTHELLDEMTAMIEENPQVALANELGNMMSVRLVQLEKAISSISVTESGMMTHVSSVHWLKAFLAITFVPSGMKPDPLFVILYPFFIILIFLT